MPESSDVLEGIFGAGLTLQSFAIDSAWPVKMDTVYMPTQWLHTALAVL
jgi:hypothetical protein